MKIQFCFNTYLSFYNKYPLFRLKLCNLHIVSLVTLFIISEHQNWFGIDENLGPVAVTIRRERVPIESGSSSSSSLGHTSIGGSHTPHHLSSQSEHWMYRLIVRTSDLLPLRGTVLEDSIPALKSEKIKTIPTKEVLEFCFPELQLTRYAKMINDLKQSDSQKILLLGLSLLQPLIPFHSTIGSYFEHIQL